MLKKEDILRNLQDIWDKHNDEYSEDSFKEYVEEYCENNFDDGYFINDEEEAEYIVDWILHNLDMAR